MTTILSDLAKERFGRLTPIDQFSTICGNRTRTFVKVICDCGNVKSVRKDWLIKQNDNCSCGCDRKEIWLDSLLQRLPNLDFATNKLRYEYRRSSIAKGLDFCLSDIDLHLCFSPCFYCGDEPKRKIYRNGALKDQYVLVSGLDRLDNKIGYMPNNVVACCSECNRHKSDRSLVDFLNHANRIGSAKDSTRIVETDLRKVKLFYDRYVKGAKSRKYAFDLTFEIFTDIISNSCYYCGREPSYYKLDWRTNDHMITNGVDRYDNSVGYTISNSVPCCQECNMAKLTTHGDVFIDKNSKVAQRFPSMVEFYKALDEIHRGVSSFREQKCVFVKG